MERIFKELGISPVNQGAADGSSRGWLKTSGAKLVSVSPIDGKPLASVIQATGNDYNTLIEKALDRFRTWRMTPAPERGEIVRQIGEQLRKYKEPLGELVSLETGKIRAEGLGEVQEMIDIADFAVGQSRMLYGLSMHSERPSHVMKEQWHPLGICGIITAFNFPVAVWSWNALLAAVCGDVCLLKPSSKTPLTAIAIHKILEPVVDRHDLAGVFNLVIGDRNQIGDPMIRDGRIPLISATGSTRMGRMIGSIVGERLGRTILELGGNNAIIVTQEADMDMAVRATLFGAVGTAGQRCTSTRRIIIHRSVKSRFMDILTRAYAQVSIGNPLEAATLMGPLIDLDAVSAMMTAIGRAKSLGGKLVCGGERIYPKGLEKGYYVTPAIMEVKNDFDVVQEETFAPILYIIDYDDFNEAIRLHNDVPQGLSSAVFTSDVHKEHLFLSAMGSDCGIANVNIGTSGAEIGGAFGGEKETGGGRESGSDAWKAYMRRQTNTINWGKDFPLAQGIVFDL
ncbi:MAG: aldehyde dehydrogenase family protein [Pseudomonadota bacterium]